MDRFVIEGPPRLEGELAVGGAKNAVLPLMAAALLGRGNSVIQNVPDLHDVRFFMTILEGLGARCSLVGGELRLDTRDAEGREAAYDLVRKMRASIYVLGPLLAFQGEARVSLPDDQLQWQCEQAVRNYDFTRAAALLRGSGLLGSRS